jgi:hypothetical protein
MYTQKNPKQVALEAIQSRSYRPLQLLEHLASNLPATDVAQLKDAIVELLEEKKIELSDNREIRLASG